MPKKKKRVKKQPTSKLLKTLQQRVRTNRKKMQKGQIVK